MRLPRMLILAASVAAAAHAQQNLVCPPVANAPGRGCETFHYHVAMYRPDTKQFAELTGINQFASQSSCERAREEASKRNLNIVNWWRTAKGDARYEADRFGPCHCDATIVDGSAVHLTPEQRIAQLRIAEEIRERVREKLIDANAPTDSEMVRGLWAAPPAPPVINTPKFAMPPATKAVTVATPSAEDLKATRSTDLSKPIVATLDLPLVEVLAENVGAAGAPPAEAPATTPASAPGATTTAGEAPAAPTVTQEAIPAASEVTVAAEAVPEAPANPEPTHVIEATTEDAELSAQEAADSFITYETERITNIINASAAIGDENVKSKIFEACTQRLQLLSNLRLLIEGAGTKSRLAGAAREAQSESERVALVAKLFGHSIGPHWAPKDAADVVVDVPSELASEPERVLRDTSGRVGDEDKRRALYVLLSRAQPTEEQRLWLTTIIDRFLQ